MSSKKFLMNKLVSIEPSLLTNQRAGLGKSLTNQKPARLISTGSRKDNSTNENGIHLKTEIPGPKSKELRAKINSMQQMGTIAFVTDMKSSKGQYLSDADGNSFLDCFMQIASMPLGYNHPRIWQALQNEDNIHLLANRPALGRFPDVQFSDFLENTFMKIAPKNLTQIYPMMCGTCSNENAIKLAFQRYMHKKRGGRTEFTDEELESTMRHEAPGSPDICILGFKGGFHGRTVGLLSCSNSKALHGVDIPTLKWPKANFPMYKYPLEENERENHKEDLKCLADVEEQIEKQEKQGVPVCAIMVEPIQAEGGDHHASPFFFQELDKICRKYDLSLIMDEVQTGGGSSGKQWCHEHFDMPNGPDIVTFSKKMMSGGIYHNEEHRPPHAGRIVNTWSGDTHKVLILNEVIKTVKEEKLLDLTNESGAVIMKGLDSLQKKYPNMISAVRGRGTIIAFDCVSIKLRDDLVLKMLQSGVVIGGCGDLAIRLRPSLTFAPRHAELMLEKFDEVLKSLA